MNLIWIQKQMRNNKQYISLKLLFIVLNILLPILLVAQADSGIVKFDTTATSEDVKLYQDLRDIAGRRKITQHIYRLIASKPTIYDPELIKEEDIEAQFRPYAGKEIEEIQIIVLSPFGGSINYPDSLMQNNYLVKYVDPLHIRTRESVIKNDLFFIPAALVQTYIGSFAAFIISTSNGFFWNSRWVFKNQKTKHSILKFYSSYLGTFILQLVITSVLMSFLNVNKYIVVLPTIAITFLLNWIFTKFWTFNKK